MANVTEHQGDLPLNAKTEEGELESLRRARATLETIFAECRAAGYDGSTTMVEFIKTRLQAIEPVKIAVAADIPFAGDDVVFIDMADQPDREVLSTILRWVFEPEAFCFVGSAPEWVRELAMAGYRVYELPAETALMSGQRSLKPHPSCIGVLWLEVKVGEVAAKLN